MLLRMTDINKFYNGNQVLSHVSLTVEDHDRIGLVGVNGCGKSTLLRILTEQELPDHLVEGDGEIARSAKTSIGYLEQMGGLDRESTVWEEMRSVFRPLLETQERMHQLEEAMQKVMDNYAGGISTHYQFNGKQLALAKEKINHLIELTGDLYASDMHELMFIYELKERLTVCLSVIAHLGARKETRWHSFAENLDYPDKSDDWMKYVNSKYENGQLHMIYRELVGREARYEHND